MIIIITAITVTVTITRLLLLLLLLIIITILLLLLLIIITILINTRAWNNCQNDFSSRLATPCGGEVWPGVTSGRFPDQDSGNFNREYGQFSEFQIAKFQIERLKSWKQICCLFVRTVSNFKLPGSRPQKQTWNSENWRYGRIFN